MASHDCSSLCSELAELSVFHHSSDVLTRDSPGNSPTDTATFDANSNAIPPPSNPSAAKSADNWHSATTNWTSSNYRYPFNNTGNSHIIKIRSAVSTAENEASHPLANAVAEQLYH